MKRLQNLFWESVIMWFSGRPSQCEWAASVARCNAYKITYTRGLRAKARQLARWASNASQCECSAQNQERFNYYG